MVPAGYIDRHARGIIAEALTDTRVVMVLGARQSGKSTLTRRVAESDHPSMIFSLDDQATRAIAQDDPTGFIAGLTGPVLIDEIQRAPDLLFAIKQAVDRDPSPGRFLLTGSANILSTKKSYEALTGRTEIVRLWPLAQSEVNGSTVNVVDELLAGRAPWITGAPVGRPAFVDIVARGGYPEARLRTGRRRSIWYRDYLEMVVERDLQDIATAYKAHEIPRLLRVLAAQAANLLEYRKLSRGLEIDEKTVKAYIKLLEDVFLVRVIRAWRPGIGRREIHTPKAYLVDTGLLAHLLGADEKRIAEDDQVTGKMLENFCSMELLKHIGWSVNPPQIFHYRDGRDEIDLVLEARNGDLACVEVKASASVRPADYRPMAKLRDARTDHFKIGVVFFTGEQTIPLTDRVWAVPVSGLWA
ncbi:MAG: ATP-binding protein [Solirubrobacterales bacterium]|nr:ATP-binding protein [Solirubrobacterales bacterium]